MVEIIYYTNNRLDKHLFHLVQRQILKSGLPVVSTSLKPINFGKNTVVKGQSGYLTMMKQIITALEASTADVVFFCEHDVLYHPSHFNFTPLKDDIFYYNNNLWRWWLGSDTLIRHARMYSLSCMCANRKFTLDHYKMRQRNIEKHGLDEFKSREPKLARRWGYEPGTKKKKRGGLTNDDFNIWESDFPNIDIRHKGTYSSPKIRLEDFKHKPTWWREININKIPGWNLVSLFPQGTKFSSRGL